MTPPTGAPAPTPGAIRLRWETLRPFSGRPKLWVVTLLLEISPLATKPALSFVGEGARLGAAARARGMRARSAFEWVPGTVSASYPAIIAGASDFRSRGNAAIGAAAGAAGGSWFATARPASP